MSRGIAASCVIASVSIGCGARSPLPDDELAAAFDAPVYADSARPSADAATACKPARGDAGACTRLTPEENTISVVCDSSPAPCRRAA